MLLADSIIETLEDLLEAITIGSPAPPAPSGTDAWDPACQPRTQTQLGTNAAGAAVEALVKMYGLAASWWNASVIQIGSYQDNNPEVPGKTKRATSPGVDFVMGINRIRQIPTYFDAAITLIHELAHVNHALQVGFFPEEVVTLVEENEYVALSWEFELVAYAAQLDGALTIYQTDETKYRECWQTSVSSDTVLTPLHSGNKMLARRAIKANYLESELRAEWNNNHSGPAPSDDLVAKWLVFKTFHNLDDLVAAWEL